MWRHLGPFDWRSCRYPPSRPPPYTEWTKDYLFDYHKRTIKIQVFIKSFNVAAVAEPNHLILISKFCIKKLNFYVLNILIY